jgi:hypothetical protein
VNLCETVTLPPAMFFASEMLQVQRDDGFRDQVIPLLDRYSGVLTAIGSKPTVKERASEFYRYFRARDDAVDKSIAKKIM